MSRPSSTTAAAAVVPETACWRVLVVDDDAGVLAITRAALRGLVVEGRPLAMTGVHSAAEAVKWLSAHSDPAVLLVDMRLENASGGAEIVRMARHTLGHAHVRVLMRSGVPADQVLAQVVDLDVSGVLGKCDVSLQDLRAAVVAAVTEFAGLQRG